MALTLCNKAQEATQPAFQTAANIQHNAQHVMSHYIIVVRASQAPTSLELVFLAVSRALRARLLLLLHALLPVDQDDLIRNTHS